jgi:hypothetical protein
MREVILYMSVRIYIIRNVGMILRKIQFSINKKEGFTHAETKN